MDKKNFMKIIGTFEEIYNNRKLSPKALKIYFEVLKEIPDEKTELIIKECLKKCKYFPRPVDVFECLEEKDSNDQPEDDIVDLRKELDL